jgi:integrase
MPFKHPKSPYWWADFTNAAGKRVRRSTGTTDWKEADALEAKWKLDAYQEKHWDKPQTRTFENLMVDYLKANTEKRSADKDRQRTKHLREVFAGQEMHTLTPSDIRKYIRHRKAMGISPSTINRETALLSAAINYANREWDWQLPNPVKGRKLKEPEGRVRWITEEEAALLIKSAGHDSRAAPYLPQFIRLALHTGCRKNELLMLEWKRVNFKDRLIFLEGIHTKSGKRRSIPLSKAAVEALKERAEYRKQWCPRSPWVFCNQKGKRIANIRNSFESARKRAGIEDFRIHDLRHTCAAWLISRGAPIAEVRDLLGHCSVTMTERYAHLAPDRVRAAVSLLD